MSDVSATLNVQRCDVDNTQHLYVFLLTSSSLKASSFALLANSIKILDLVLSFRKEKRLFSSLKNEGETLLNSLQTGSNCSLWSNGFRIFAQVFNINPDV